MEAGQLSFGPFVLSPGKELRREGSVVPIGQRALTLLEVMVRADGEVVTKAEILEKVWSGVTVETRVNGELRQQGTTRDFIFPLDVVLRYISAVMTLFPGDLVATGTPSGVGPLIAGDQVSVSAEGIPALLSSVKD